MKSVKWFYVGAMAIALGMLTFATVACHDDDDDPKPAEGEVIETPKPVVEYYIMGTVTSGGKAMNGVKVKVGSKNYTTDSNGKFSVTESATGTYSIEASSNGYLSQKTGSSSNLVVNSLSLYFQVNNYPFLLTFIRKYRH